MKEVTKKSPKRVKAGKKGYPARLLKMKEPILPGTTASNVPSNTTTNVSSNTSNATSNFSNASNAATIKSTDVYIYSIGLVVILVVGLCVFYTFKGKEKVQPQQPVQQAEQQTKKTRGL